MRRELPLTVALGVSFLHLLFALSGFGPRRSGVLERALAPDTAVIVLMLIVLLHRVVKDRGCFATRSAAAMASVIFAGLMIVYVANGRTLGGGDTVPARYLPLSILREGNFDLDEFRFLYTPELPSYVRHVRDHYVSDYPVGAALLALPFYVPVALTGADASRELFAQLEKVSAAAVVATSAVVLYLALRQVTTAGASLAFTLVYGLATSSFSTGSQGLWQHGPSQLALAAALYCLSRARREPRWAALAGTPMGFAVLSRPTDLILVAPLFAYAVLRHRPQRLAIVAGVIPPAAFQLWYNATYFGDPWRTQFPVFVAGTWDTPLGAGLAGILLSPGRGLFVYSPILVFSFAGLILAWRRGGDPLLRTLSVGVLALITLYAKFHTWWGGASYGPRLLADLSPVLVLGLYPLTTPLAASRFLKVLFVCLALWSVTAHAIGVYAGGADWNGEVNVDREPHRVWSWRDSAPLDPLFPLISRPLIFLRSVPSSRTHPHLLAATYLVEGPAVIGVAEAAGLELPLTARNTGRAVWLAAPTPDTGVVRLAWRWISSDGQVVATSARKPRRRLRYDVFPGQSHRFWVLTVAPRVRGTYTLELGLISEAMGSFADFGSPPVRVPVHVLPRSTEHMGAPTWPPSP